MNQTKKRMVDSIIQMMQDINTCLIAVTKIEMEFLEDLVSNIQVNNKNISKMIGQAKRNIKRLNELGYNCRVKGDNTITGSEIYIEC